MSRWTFTAQLTPSLMVCACVDGVTSQCVQLCFLHVSLYVAMCLRGFKEIERRRKKTSWQRKPQEERTEL